MIRWDTSGPGTVGNRVFRKAWSARITFQNLTHTTPAAKTFGQDLVVFGPGFQDENNDSQGNQVSMITDAMAKAPSRLSVR